MAENGCSNCETLHKHCLALRDELESLKLRIDNITQYLSIEKHDKNLQTDSFTVIDSCCQTDKLTLSDHDCQTEITPKP